MKFTLSEWNAIKRYLATALDDAEDLVSSLEAEIKDKPDYTVVKDYMAAKMSVAELEGFIARIESATV
ncbi:MAG: hypothetical protein LUH03_11070 [Oscillospiraceae bacterium]|nr:hypothetical protein [Oscillospiraceae bacterium]